MAAEMLNKLQELVTNICDNLYLEKKLITKNSVKALVQLHGYLDEDELETKLPGYINTWRASLISTDTMSTLEAQLCKYKAELFNAQQTINRLKAELLERTTDLNMLRKNILQDLRGLLHG